MDEYFNEEGAPLKCRACGCEWFKFVADRMVGCQSMGAEVRCRACNAYVTYWAYGNYEQQTKE